MIDTILQYPQYFNPRTLYTNLNIEGHKMINLWVR
jgi:hypothetical protein